MKFGKSWIWCFVLDVKCLPKPPVKACLLSYGTVGRWWSLKKEALKESWSLKVYPRMRYWDAVLFASWLSWNEQLWSFHEALCTMKSYRSITRRTKTSPTMSQHFFLLWVWLPWLFSHGNRKLTRRHHTST